jgi:hypothetical protein
MNNKTATITYSGGFHNCEPISLRVKIAGGRIGKLSEGQERKLANHFCGIPGCTCGGVYRATLIDDGGLEIIEASWV